MEKFDLYGRIYFVGKPPSKDFFCRKGSQLGSVTLKDFSFEITSKAGDMNAKDEPKYAGARPFVISMNKSVPIPFISKAIDGLIPKM